MTKIQDPISQIHKFEEEAKNLINTAENKAKEAITQVENKRQAEIAMTQKDALIKAKDLITKAQNEIIKHKDDNKKKIEEQLTALTQSAKNNFSKVGSLVVKVLG